MMSAFGENLKRSESEHHITLILLECVDVAETREFMSEREREREGVRRKLRLPRFMTALPPC